MRSLSVALGTFLLFIGCAAPSAEGPLSEEDLTRVRSVIQAYAEAWKAGDSAAVLGLFTEDAVIFPSGLSPREGKQALREFWFPDDGSVTRVLSYPIETIDAGGAGTHAFTTERGDLSFTYALGDFFVSRSSKAHATTLYSKQPDGSWKIRHRMWTDLPTEH